MKKYLIVFVLISFLFNSCSYRELDFEDLEEEKEIAKDEDEKDIDEDEEPEFSSPSVRSFTEVTLTTDNNIAQLEAPEDAEEGDLMIAILAINSGAVMKPAHEEGWVRIVNQKYGSGTPTLRVFWKKRTADDSDAYEFSVGSAGASGKAELIAVKNWTGSAPTALSVNTDSSIDSYKTPDSYAVSPTGGDLILNTVALAAVGTLADVEWEFDEEFDQLTEMATEDVAMSTAAKANSKTNFPDEIKGNIISAYSVDITRNAGAVALVVPASSTRPIIRVYRGGASKTVSGGVDYYFTSEAIIDILKNPELHYDVRSVGENEVDPITAEALLDADLYVQPGGPTIPVGWDYIKDKKELIRDYLNDGGRFMGNCFGAYMFGNYYDQTGDSQSFELFPPGNYAYTYSSYDGAVYDDQDGTAMVDINLKDIWGSGTRTTTISGGNYFYLEGDSIPDLAVLATYDQPDGSEPPAAIRFSFDSKGDGKKGWVVGIGPHPEANATWGGPSDPDGWDHDLIEIAVKDLLERE